MFDFIKGMFERGRIDADKVMSYVPKYITLEQAQQIISGVN